MKKILVTGSNGQLGRALHQLLQNSDADVIYTTSKDLDIRDEKAKSGGNNDETKDH